MIQQTLQPTRLESRIDRHSVQRTDTCSFPLDFHLASSARARGAAALAVTLLVSALAAADPAQVQASPCGSLGVQMGGGSGARFDGSLHADRFLGASGAGFWVDSGYSVPYLSPATFAQREDGQFVAFGDNLHGLCELPAVPSGTGFVDIRSSSSFAVGLLDDGALLVWGDLGSGVGQVPVLPTGVVFEHVACGGNFVAGLRSDGLIETWGSSWQLVPVPALPAGMTYTAVAAGRLHALGLRSDGWIVRWNASGQTTNTPALPAGVVYTKVVAGNEHGLALRSDGAIVHWGEDLGSGKSVRYVPPLPAGKSYVDVESGAFHALALRSDGVAVAWGFNDFGQCDVPAVPVGRSVARISAGGSVSRMILDDGTLLCWGMNSMGQCNSPRLPDGVSFVQLAVEDFFGIVGLRSDGLLEAFGFDVVGAKYVKSKAPLPAPGHTFVQVEAGSYLLIARQDDGEVVTWDSIESSMSVPPVSALPSDVKYVDVSGGGQFFAALRSDDVVERGGFFSYPTPALPPGVHYVDIECGVEHIVAIRSDGSAVAWGANTFGQCDVPALPAGRTFTKLAASYSNSAGLLDDGTIAVWGNSAHGLLHVPAPAAGTHFTDVELGEGVAVARQSDGTFVSWGLPVPVLSELAPVGWTMTNFKFVQSTYDYSTPYPRVAWLLEPDTASSAPYCTAKQNSAGCWPSISLGGAPSSSGAGSCHLSTSALMGTMTAMNLHSVAGSAAIPLHGGVLCLAAPIVRHAPQGTGGTWGACDGSLQEDLNAYLASGADPFVQPGLRLHLQTWSRDAGDAFGDSLSDALATTVCP